MLLLFAPKYMTPLLLPLQVLGACHCQTMRHFLDLIWVTAVALLVTAAGMVAVADRI